MLISPGMTRCSICPSVSFVDSSGPGRGPCSRARPPFDSGSVSRRRNAW